MLILFLFLLFFFYKIILYKDDILDKNISGDVY
jgi:hypothetical protein